MSFIYEETNLKEEDENLLIKYTNDVSVWVVFDNEKKEYCYQARIGKDVLREFPKLEVCETFVDGMAQYAKREGDIFKEENINELPDDIDELRRQLYRANKEKEKSRLLAEKLIKGIVKKTGNLESENLNDIIRKYAASI